MNVDLGSPVVPARITVGTDAKLQIEAIGGDSPALD